MKYAGSVLAPRSNDLRSGSGGKVKALWPEGPAEIAEDGQFLFVWSARKCPAHQTRGEVCDPLKCSW
jgi:hypothetical protein